MRAGGCTMQQALTAEAASVVKQAVSLAKRRGHAQVTPLHVANTMLLASTGLLRTACLQSHSHPLQCKALELCFNVALNRLPTSSSSTPILAPHSQHYPSISNALVAAFKRAQAHQRRGSIENQQQPLLAVKIELEQLIISILDDPSVSRVMREAGFSSTQVKNNVEQAVSLELCSSQTLPAHQTNSSKQNTSLLVLGAAQVGKTPATASISSTVPVRDEDVMSVVDSMMKKRRKSIVIVGECVASIEGVVREVMNKVDRGDVPEALREVKFISLPHSTAHLSREEVEQKLGELRCLVKSFLSKGVVLYLGDLKWTGGYRGSSTASHEQGSSRSYYCPVEHMIMELGRLVCGIGESSGSGSGSERLWLMGLATFHTYMRCRTGHPSLESIWGLYPLTIPAGSLALSLIPDSDIQSDESRSKKGGNCSSWFQLLEGGEDQKQLNCCTECSAKFESEARSLRSSTCNSEATTSSLPSWLQQYKDENKRLSSNDQDTGPVSDLCKKWNSFCSSVHKQPHSSERTITFSSVSPSSSTSGFSYDHQYPNFHQTHQGHWSVFEPKQSWRDHHFWTSEAANKTPETGLRMYIPEHRAFSSNPNSTPNSASSSEFMEMEYVQRFKELSSENLKTLCSALERKVPWQRDIVPEIASTVLQCRSGMVRRKGKVKNSSSDQGCKEETWLFFQGVDSDGKDKIGRELARLVFGSQSKFVSIALSSFSSTRADSTEDLRNKRSRDEQSCSYVERFAEAVSTNPHRVFLVEDVEQADYCSQMGIKRAIETGRLSTSNGEEVLLRDAIVILSCESFSSRSRACSPPTRQKSEEEKATSSCTAAGLEETSPCVSLDLNISFDDDESAQEDQSIDDIGLLESVDRRIIFKIQEL